MFRKSGFSIAMGNASDEVKKRADVVTDSYDAEGFAKAVNKYLLPSVKDRATGTRQPSRRPRGRS
jgi:3-deoxy-D-manno-octulosonate 8-phosphate phosphatase KdsC-like HAD superfamily phosphatase